MATVPSDIQEGIKKLSDAVEIPVKSLMERLKEIISTDETIQTMEKDDFKIRYAWALLYREHSMRGKTTDCYIMPICSTRVREIKMKGEKTSVGDMTALVQKIEKDEDGNPQIGDVMYASGTFWRDGAKHLEALEPGKVYKSSLIINDNSWGVSITSDRAGFAPVEHKMPSFKEFYEKEIKPKDISITIGEMDLNKSETTTDIRVVEATVIESEVGETADKREYGRYTVMDDSVIGSNFAIFVSPEDVKWSQGSILKFGGTIDIDDKTGAVRWSNQFILPTDLALPKEIVVKPVTSEKLEEVDISEPEPKPETPVEEQPKEEKPEENKEKEEASDDFEI